MIEDHQDLLEKYVSESLSVIGEFSGPVDSYRDIRALRKEVEEYAARQGLTVNDEWFSSYAHVFQPDKGEEE